MRSAHIKTLTVAVIAMLAMLSACMVIADASEDADAAQNSDYGVYTGGSHASPVEINGYYSGIEITGFNNLRAYAASEGTAVPLIIGSSVSIDVGSGTWIPTSVTSGFGLTITEDGSVTGTVTSAGLIEFECYRASVGTGTTYTAYILVYGYDEIEGYEGDDEEEDDTVYVTSIRITEASGSTTIGSTLTLRAVTSPTSADDRHVEWSITSGSSRASISSTTDTSTGGRVTLSLTAAGSVTVRATAADGGGFYADYTFTVEEETVYVTSVTVSGSTSGTVGSTVTLTATTSPTSADDRTVTWSITSGSAYASISSTTDTSTGGTATITLNAAGTVTVRATAADGGGAYATRTITISQPSIEITTSQSDVTIAVGQQFTYQVGADVSGVTVTVSGADWLTVSGDTIYGTPTSTGTYDVTVTVSRTGYTSATQTFTVTVISSLGFTSEPSNGVIAVEV